MYLKRNVPELGDRAGRGRGHIVQRLEGLGRSKLPVWVHLLHGCLRGVDILRHGRARRSVGRRGAATGWSARNMAHLKTAGVLECAERLVEAPRILHLTHARATQIAQSARTEARRRGREGGGGCGGCGGRGGAKAPARCPCAASRAAPAAPLAAARPAPVARRQTRVRGGERQAGRSWGRRGGWGGGGVCEGGTCHAVSRSRIASHVFAGSCSVVVSHGESSSCIHVLFRSSSSCASSSALRRCTAAALSGPSWSGTAAGATWSFASARCCTSFISAICRLGALCEWGCIHCMAWED